MLEQPERVITWGEVLPGDVIRGADGAEWTIEARYRRAMATTVVMTHGDRELAGTPRSDSAVTLLHGGTIRAVMTTFAVAGLPAHYEGTEQTLPSSLV